MLLQSTYTIEGDGTPNASITLLPALPDKWEKGSIKGIRARGGYTVDMEWADGKVTKAAIKATADGYVSISCNGKTRKIKTKKGKTVHIH